ncbi:hypothetical protein AVEN_273633-1 [Araneus ventricosus]|uniref:Uncharacterized protein n=1 Tax=Araneus ventricosus TaxID=182803 RepID=A0A4Y2RDR4_ARAVE|nr:hypothetical protein AVEN_273633-1 [Araneus ventricosus]
MKSSFFQCHVLVLTNVVEWIKPPESKTAANADSVVHLQDQRIPGKTSSRRNSVIFSRGRFLFEPKHLTCNICLAWRASNATCHMKMVFPSPPDYLYQRFPTCGTRIPRGTRRTV